MLWTNAAVCCTFIRICSQENILEHLQFGRHDKSTEVLVRQNARAVSLTKNIRIGY